ncbi:glyoxalase superfamily protein [Phycobacter sp. K97]|uniref:glyoxalase superfamily protein n=1 Tax=Phycobacter sedimenti TaxID=3133977 RepID=UPI00311DA361
MRDFTDSKSMAKTLRAGLAAQGVDISHAQALELVARQFGVADWNTLSAQILARQARPLVRPAIPIIRSFDDDQARDFYVDYLGFSVEWQYRHADDLPLYMQISRSECLLHISGHHGDATPGGRSFIRIEGIKSFHGELQSKEYRNLKPGLDRQPWGLEVNLTDPFGNRLTFCEQRGQD